MLPVEAQTTAALPSSTAFDSAMVMPRSLNEPVGFIPSYLRKIRSPPPISRASLGAGTSGVEPSPSVTTGVRSLTGRKLR